MSWVEVPRDAINIAALAAQHANDEPISITHVRRASRDWFLRDKQTAISTNEAARHMLQQLVNEVVGRRRSRTFVLDHQARAMTPSTNSTMPDCFTFYDAASWTLSTPARSTTGSLLTMAVTLHCWTVTRTCGHAIAAAGSTRSRESHPMHSVLPRQRST